MVNNSDFKEKIKNIENEYNLTHYEVLQRFMFERILERISISKYKDNFILKGGLLLSAMFGIDNRTTKDMDTTITGIDVSKEKVMKILNEILSIDINDSVKFDLINITDIRQEDEYGGNKYHIVGKFGNLKVNLEIDISTGDKVTPRQLKFKYPLTFEDRSILINSYNMETILSEKIETVLRRGRFNSRMKDFYDIYYFLKYLKNDMDMNILKMAIKNTFDSRDSLSYFKDYKEIMNSIRYSELMIKQWKIYSNKYNYANNISFNDILDMLEKFLNIL